MTREREQARRAISDLETRLVAVADFQRLAPDQQAELRTAFDRALAAIANASGVATLQRMTRDFVDGTYPHLLVRMKAWLQPPAPIPVVQGAKGADSSPQAIHPPAPLKPVFVKTWDLAVSFDRAWLAAPEDVDRYLAGLREVMLATLADGKHIQL
jgi:hypothetical protein